MVDGVHVMVFPPFNYQSLLGILIGGVSIRGNIPHYGRRCDVVPQVIRCPPGEAAQMVAERLEETAAPRDLTLPL